VNFTGSFVSGQICVQAISTACGSGPFRCLTVYGAPTTPAVITGNAAPCSGAVENYSTAGSSGATSYIWTYPAGTSALGGTTSSTITLLIGPTAGNITVRASNSCGTSGPRTLPITIPCRMSQLLASASAINAEAFPNPTDGKTTLKFNSNSEAKYLIKVLDITGRVIMSDVANAIEGINLHELDLSNVAKGIYMVTLQTEGMDIQTLKVTVE
jgi:hypothetical protein